MKLCWLAHNLLLLPLAGKHRIPFHSGWDCVIFVFLTLLAGKKPSNMIAGWDFHFPKVLLASNEATPEHDRLLSREISVFDEI